MRRILGLVAIVSVWMTTPAFAMEPPASSDPQATSTSATAGENKATSSSAQSTSPATGANASQVKLTAGDDEAAAQLKRFKAAGYKPEVRNGEIVFCRTETQMGSRFERKVCTTAQQLELQIARAQADVSEAQRRLVQSPQGH